MATPRYKEIALVLRSQIEAGQWPKGSRLPTVRALADSWGVSRVTAQRATNELTRLGYTRAHGRNGTVVLVDRRPPLLTEAIDAIGSGRAIVVATETVPADEQVAHHLDVPLGSRIQLVQLAFASAGQDEAQEGQPVPHVEP